MRGLTKTHTINGQEFTVHELKLDEIDAFLKEIDVEEDKSVLDVMTVKGVHLSAVARCVGMTKAELRERFPYPSEMQFVANKCEEINGGFFDVVRLALNQIQSLLQGKG